MHAERACSRSVAYRARQRHARAPADRRAARGVAAAAGRAPQRRRRPPRSTDPTARRHRHRPGAASPGAGRLPEGKLLDRCSRFRRTNSAGADELATRIVLRSLARRIQAATVEAAELEREILAHVRALAPTLLDEPGVGPIVAAQLIVAWSHHGRPR